MGSSKSGNLDQLAQFNLPAALASGKVKLPESGAIGAMQGQAEDNKVMKEQALAAQMNQQVPSYMMPGESNQQMYPQPAAQTGQAQMNYLRQHLPYEDGGHVALRRKMFKLGGDVNTHGVGITSGLSYNTGGRVTPKRGLVDEPGSYGGVKKEAAELGLGLGSKGLAWLKKIFDKRSIGMGEKKFKSNIADYVRGPRTAADANKWMRFLGKPLARTIRATVPTSTAAGLSAVPLSLLGDYGDPSQEAEGTGFERATRLARMATEFGLDWSAPGIAYEIQDYLRHDPTEMGDHSLSDWLTGRERGPASGEAIFKESEAGGRSDEEIDFTADKRERDRQRMQEIYEDYRSLYDREDQPETLAGKFFGNPELGDALISGGSALMQGEGWGPSAEAFNAPLTEARLLREGKESDWRQMAASQAISDMSSEDAATQAALAEHLGAGDFDLAEATRKYQWAKQQAPQMSMIPTDENGKLDQDAIKDIQIAGGGVFMDVTNVSGTGKVFIAIKTAKEMLPTNDLEEAQKYVAS